MTGNTEKNTTAVRKPILRRVPEDKRPPASRKAAAGKRGVGYGPIFWIVWLTLFIAIAVAWGFVMRYAAGLLNEYEQSQPKYVAERVFNEYFKSCDYEYLISHSDDIKISPMENMSDAVDYASGLFKDMGEWHYSQTSSDDPDVLKYNVSVGKARVGEFTLVKSGNQSNKLKLDIYTLGSTQISLSALCGANIYAPAKAVVKVNGIVLGDEYKFGDPVVLKEDVFYPEGDVAARTMQNYFIDGLFKAPTVTVESAEGVEYALEYDQESVIYRADSSYINGLVDAYNKKIADEQAAYQAWLQQQADLRRQESEKIRADIGEYAVTAIQTYARWMQDDATKAERNKYFDTSSEFYRSLDKLISQSFIMYHRSYRFDDVKDENYRYENDEKTDISGHISFTQVLEECTDIYGDKTYPEWKNYIDVTVYMHLVNGKWLIYDIRNDAQS